MTVGSAKPRLLGVLFLVGCSSAANVERPPLATCEPATTTRVELEVSRAPDDPLPGAWLPLVVETELAHVPTLVPRLAPLPPLPALDHGATDETRVMLEITETLADARVCRAQRCTHVTVPWSPQTLEQDGAELAASIASQLGHPVPHPAASVWVQDPYTRRIAARAAAIALGDRPPPTRPGDRRTDPLARAMWLQPTLAPVQWLALRTSADEPERLPALRRIEREGSDPLHTAVLAEVNLRADQPRRSLELWTDLLDEAPADVRWRLPAAEAALAADRPRTAARALTGITQPRREVTEARVRIADHRPDGADLELLEDWADATADDPEPIGRLVDAHLADANLQAVLDLTDELERRGALQEADRLRQAIRSSQRASRPTLERVESVRAAHVETLAEADALLFELSTTQNDWLRASEAGEDPCGAAGLERLSRTRRLGTNAHSALVRARRTSDRLATLLASPDVDPLLSDDAAETAWATISEVDVLENAYMASIVVQQDYLVPATRGCP